MSVTFDNIRYDPATREALRRLLDAADAADGMRCVFRNAERNAAWRKSCAETAAKRRNAAVHTVERTSAAAADAAAAVVAAKEKYAAATLAVDANEAAVKEAVEAVEAVWSLPAPTPKHVSFDDKVYVKIIPSREDELTA